MSLADIINNQPPARAREALGWHIETVYSVNGTTRYWVGKTPKTKRLAKPSEIAKWKKTLDWYSGAQKVEQP